MSESNGGTWDHAADEHHYMHNILVNIATRAGEDAPVGKALDQAEAALNTSVRHHGRGEFRAAHSQLQIAGEHLSRAAALGSYHDKQFGMSQQPKDAAEGEVISYKHGYLS